MNRQPTRTDLVEAYEAEVYRLVSLSVDAKTDARAYRDLADFISTFPAGTPFHQVAAEELSKVSHNQARLLAMQADELERQAKALKEAGCPE